MSPSRSPYGLLSLILAAFLLAGLVVAAPTPPASGITRRNVEQSSTLDTEPIKRDEPVPSVPEWIGAFENGGKKNEKRDAAVKPNWIGAFEDTSKESSASKRNPQSDSKWIGAFENTNGSDS